MRQKSLATRTKTMEAKPKYVETLWGPSAEASRKPFVSATGQTKKEGITVRKIDSSKAYLVIRYPRLKTYDHQFRNNPYSAHWPFTVMGVDISFLTWCFGWVVSTRPIDGKFFALASWRGRVNLPLRKEHMRNQHARVYVCLYRLRVLLSFSRSLPRYDKA